MKVEFVTSGKAGRLLLIFAGWSMDHRPLSHLTRSDYDLAVAYDYSSMEFPCIDRLGQYEEICVVAWSFGVVPAAMFINSHTELPITAKIAVNGTHHPVDDHKGIPTEIFKGTLEHLSAGTLAKFQRRMCGSATAFSDFQKNAPQRDMENLRAELESIASLPHISSHSCGWDTVYISDRDMIVPTTNQHNAWAGHHDVRDMEGGHLPDFRKIIDATISCKPLIRQRFGKAADGYDTNASIQAHVAEKLADMLLHATDRAKTGKLLEIGTGTGMLTRLIHSRLWPAHTTLWDLTDIPDELPGEHLTCDAETEIMRVADESIDIIASSSTIQWFNSPAAFVKQCERALRAGGTIALSTFGPDNFTELQPLLPDAPRYISAEGWRKITDKLLSHCTITEEQITLHFDSPLELLRHIHNTGVNATNTTPMRAKSIINAGITSLTYHPIYIVGRKN